MRGTSRSGFTLIELMLVLGLVGVITFKLSFVLKQANDVHREESTGIALQDQASRVIEQIAWKVIAARRATVTPEQEAPEYTEVIRYQTHIGFENGEPLMSDPEFITLSENGDQVKWGLEDNSRTVTWCNTVREYLLGELGGDSIDNNENGLFDEAGLTFDIDRDLVRIQLTLTRKLSTGESISYSETTSVTCRN